MRLSENELEFDFSGCISACKFDDPATHKLSHCMKAVDFVVEFPERVLYVEVKDPQNSSADPRRAQEFIEKFKKNEINSALSAKCRDTFVYHYAEGEIDKPITYIVLIAHDGLTEADLVHRADSLRKYIPVDGPPMAKWKVKFVDNCIVMNIATWKKFLPQFPVRRLV